MAIPVKQEPIELGGDDQDLERCFFCGFPTLFWHEETNNPVCNICARKHKVTDLPDNMNPKGKKG